jgi:hypothetical protein
VDDASLARDFLPGNAGLLDNYPAQTEGTIVKDKMPVQTKELTWANVDLDDTAQVHELIGRKFQQSKDKLQCELQRLQDRGIIDENGNLLSKELPPTSLRMTAPHC